MDLNDLVGKIGIKSDENPNKAINTYNHNASETKKALEPLLSEFSRLTTNKTAPEIAPLNSTRVFAYYDYLYKNLEMDYDINDLERLAFYLGNREEIDHQNYNQKLGLFISAAINHVLKKGEGLRLNFLVPIDFLLLGLKNAEVHMNIAGNFLGYSAENCNINAMTVGENAGAHIKKSEIHVHKASHYFGWFGENSKMYAETAGNSAGYGIKNSELHLGKAEKHVGNNANNSKIYVEEAGDFAGDSMQESELRVGKTYEYLGFHAENSKIYADEAGDEAGKSMKTSELYIGKLHGNLNPELFKLGNIIYLGDTFDFVRSFPFNKQLKMWEK